MIVCICRAVSDRSVHQAIAEGASSVEDLGKRCGAGTCCGSCVEELSTMLRARGRAQTGDCQPRAQPVASGPLGGAS